MTAVLTQPRDILSAPLPVFTPAIARRILGLSAVDIAIIFSSVLLAIVYALLVRPGTPADEPAHFSNIQFYAHHLKMPILGDPHIVDYEAQMGPVYYTLSASIYRLFEPLGEKSAFFAIRFAGLMLIIPHLLCLHWLTRRILPGCHGVATLVLIFAGLNPSVTAIAASIQNDYLTTLLCVLSIVLSVRWLIDKKGSDPAPTPRHALLLGILVSGAILTKAGALFLAPTIFLFALFLHRKKSITFLFLFTGTIIALTAWWFLRNKFLYGDFTAQTFLRTHGYGNASDPVSISHPKEIAAWLWAIKTYYWYPSEFYRGLFHITVLARAIVVLVTLLALVGWILAIVRHSVKNLFQPRETALLLLAFAFCFAIYTFSSFTVTNFAPRTTFGVLLVYVIVITLGPLFLFRSISSRHAPLITMVVLATCMLGANIYCLSEIHKLPVYPFNLFT